MQRRLAIVVHGVDLSVPFYQKLCDVDVTREDGTVQWSLIPVVLCIDVRHHRCIAQVFIEKEEHLLLVSIANSLEQTLVGLVLKGPPVLPGDDLVCATVCVHLDNVFTACIASLCISRWKDVQHLKVLEMARFLVRIPFDRPIARLFLFLFFKDLCLWLLINR